MRLISFVRSAMTVVIALAFVLVSCQKEPDTKVSNITLYVESLEAKPEGDTFRINYSIVKPAEGVSLEVACDAEWVSVDVVTASFVDITVAKNDSGEERSVKLIFGYGNDTNSLTISQKAWEAPVALKVEDVEATAVVFSVTTLNDNTTWIGQIVDKVWFDQMSEDEVFSEDMRYYIAMAEERGVTLEEYLSTILSTGSHSNIRMAGLDPEWEYVVYVYGMNAAGEKTTSLYSEAFKTEAPYAGNDVTFDFDITVNRAIAHIAITPSHEGVAYYNNLITYEDYETLYDKDINAAADAVIADMVEDYAAWDYTLAETFEYNTDYLATSYEFEGMANTKYIAFAFKWNEECKRLSDVSFEEFEIGSIPASENKLSMEISDITQSTFYVKVETTNDDPYAMFAISAKEIAKLRDDAEIFDYILGKYGTSFLYNYLFNGPIEGTFSGLEADTNYAVLLFGYEAGTLTTKIVRKNITTAAAGDIEACQYNIEVTEIDDREARVSIIPTDYSVWYYWNVFEASMSEEEIKDYIWETYNEAYYGDYWEFSYYELAQGKVSSRLSQLKPDTEYHIVIIPMNPDSFEYTGTMRTGGEFRTEVAIIADIKITAGFDAYYDGDEVYAINPDYFSNYQGQVILPMTVEIEGDCSGYLFTIFTYQEGLEDPAMYSDDILIDNLYNVGAYWSPAYFRGAYDVEMMIAAVAFDYDDNPSPVYRERFICTRDGAGDAQEFVDYYLGGVSAVSMSLKSMVVNDGCNTLNGVEAEGVQVEKSPVVRTSKMTFERK